MFKLKDKIVCIDDAPPVQGWNHGFQEWPKLNREYTVKRCYQWNNTWGVLLEEIKNKPVFIPLLGGKAEPGFGIYRFRKIQESESTNEVEQELKLAA